MKLQLTFHLLLLMTLQLYHFLPPIFPPVSNSSCLYTSCQPLYASCCTVLLYFSRYSTVRLKNCFFFVLYVFVCFLMCLFFVYYLCEKYFKSVTTQDYVVDCVGWILKPTLLNLETNWTYKHALGMELMHT